MAKLFNRAKMDTSTTGSGTITLGSAVDGYQSFADAGVADSDVVQYVIEDGNSWEIGTGTYSATGTSLTRTPSESSNAGAAISLTGAAEVFITAVADDLNRLQNAGSTKVEATSTGATVTGNIAVTGTVDGRDIASDGSKLDGIESGATADQTASEILTAIKTVDGSGSGLDADTLDSYHATDFVGAAGDTMTGDLLVQSDIKATGQIRATGWWNTNTGTTGSGLATEIGVSSSESYILSYNRDNATYGDLNFSAVNFNFDERGGTTTIENNEIWHAGNDGSGSGLDADTLDGIQGANFVRSDTGDTMSGSYTMTGSLTLSQDGQDVLNFSANDTNDARGISFNNRSALTADYNDGWLRLNALSEFSNGVYTPSNFTMGGNAYLAGTLYHYGDTDTYLSFGTNTITLATGGSSEITVNTTGVRLGDTGNGYFQPVSGSYGSIQIDGGAHGGWEGYSIGGRIVFMHDNASGAGIYNDVDNEWMFYAIRNGETRMYHNGSAKVVTTSSGANINGNLTVTGSISGVSGAKVWASWDGYGTASLRADIGVSSLTDQGIGRYYLNLSTSAPNLNYALAGDTSNNDPVYTTNNDFATSFGRGHRTSTTFIEALSVYTYDPNPRDGGNYCSTLAFW